MHSRKLRSKSVKIMSWMNPYQSINYGKAFVVAKLYRLLRRIATEVNGTIFCRDDYAR
jgi:hypothetical protein